MALAKFGKKRICFNCSTKFYCLNQKPPLKCPHCDTEINLENDLYENHQMYRSDSVKNNNNTINAPNDIDALDENNTDNLQEDDNLISLEEVEDDQDQKN